MSGKVFLNPTTGKVHRPCVADYPYEPPWTACGRHVIDVDGSDLMVLLPVSLEARDRCRACWPATR